MQWGDLSITLGCSQQRCKTWIQSRGSDRLLSTEGHCTRYLLNFRSAKVVNIRKCEEQSRVKENEETTLWFWTGCTGHKGLSVQFSRSVVSKSLRHHGLQHTRPPCPSPTPRAYSNSCLLSQWCHPTISSSLLPSLPAFNLSQHQGLFQWVSSSHQVAKVLELQLQHQWICSTDFL